MKDRNEFLKKLYSQAGIVDLNEMQKSTIKASTESDEIMLFSPTGSGKTLAFLLSLAQKLTKGKGVQSIILSPSRELALQIEAVFKSLKSEFHVVSCFGGHAFSVEKNNLKADVDLIVGTPGRLRDHMEKGTFDYSDVEMLVLDEFDKSLELGFQKDMQWIISSLYHLEFKMLVSATKMEEIPQFTGISKPKVIDFLEDESKIKISQKAIYSKPEEKSEDLLKLLLSVEQGRTLVFCNHKQAVDRLSDFLKDHLVPHDVYHGDRDQESREKALIKLRNGSINLLVVTDLAARGLDIPEIKHVMHYQLPVKEDAYIHRNGRTARMTAEGTSYLMLTEGDIPKYVKRDVERVDLDEVDLKTQYPLPEWVSIFVGRGKKDKVNKIDLVGFFCQQGGVEKASLGKIDVLDFISVVALKRGEEKTLLKNLKGKKIKKKPVRVGMIR